MHVRSSFVGALSALALWQVASLGRADDAAPAPAEVAEKEAPKSVAKPAPADKEPATPVDPRVRPIEPGQGKPRPYAPDDRTGHVYIRGGTALVLPTGSIRSNVATNAIVGPGLGFVAGIGVGISRYAELDLLGTYALMQSAGGQGGGRCVGCSGDHASLSLGLTYHLVQGVALDPWMRFGTGYRTANYQGASKSAQLDYFAPGRVHGWDVAQLSLGAMFFPVSSFGLGPFAEADIGTYLNRPVIGNDPGSPRPYAFFQLGLEVEIDPVRWVKPSAPPAKNAGASGQPSF